ncbi:GNAT family N-acetyltransferase [Actinoplanes subglobosus]|uniref:GNAT family N-acetyltransferase n=1 Tax=Actinoplanes subglobosus TaxID=1547892 RepID=A0ABV8J7A6_9ACTN
MTLTVRLATHDDLPALRELMAAAITELQKGFLSQDQIAASAAIMGLDTQLVDDRTYFAVVEDAGEVDGDVDGEKVDGKGESGREAIRGCGGWSRRATLYGGDHTAGRDAALLDPAQDTAKVRAMYTHPAHARRGIGRMILTACEEAAAAEGFRTLELMGTMSGQPLYTAAGFVVVEHLHDDRGGAPVPLVRMRKTITG